MILAIRYLKFYRFFKQNTNFNGLLVDPQNSIDLASKIIMLIKKPKLCNDLGEKARESVIKNFDEKVIVNEFLNSINKKNN